MHEEFGLRYERRWLSKFGVNYYGCCEPLHEKLDVLAMRAQPAQGFDEPLGRRRQAVPEMAGRYVFAASPARRYWPRRSGTPSRPAGTSVEVLDKTSGCAVEIIMKDISTVRGKPQRLWQWAEMAMEVAQQFG